MGGAIKKIFMILGMVVVLVLGAALVINIIFPNATIAIVNYVEDTIYSASGARMDLNGDGASGQKIEDGNVRQDNSKQNENNEYENSYNVDGFGGSGDTP